ncbi:MAG TPA: hypothetical protein VEJ47_18135 [Candidatus Eremiobacteraceae bacterium]|nr:hypothetical protein [Candidatus Eremiobacteraceae bacterium]
MRCVCAICVVVLACALGCLPAYSAGAPNVAPLGTIIAADHAHVGEGTADVGTTIYAGDYIHTDERGSVQVRAGAARLLLLGASSAVVNSEGFPSAKLLAGTATFSTAKANAFTLFASTAAIRAQTDSPTIAQVAFLNEKEIVVTARRSSLVVTVEGDTQVIQEGQSYRVALDTDSQGPQGAGGGGPLKAGRSRFLLLATALVAAGTAIAIYYAMESSDRP